MKKIIPSIKLSILSECNPEKFGHSHPSINKSNIDLSSELDFSVE